MAASGSPVNSHNEWDPLEEVIVGTLDGAMLPAWNVINRCTVPEGEWEGIERAFPFGGPYPPAMVEAAGRALAGFVHILEGEGVRVRRPDPCDVAAARVVTPAWSVDGGWSAANPRDPFLVIGDEILETPMPDRGRQYESWPYRRLFNEYFKAGARWTAAPRPRLLDELYDGEWRHSRPGEPTRFVLTEAEPVFDAADVARCGRDLFMQTSHVTNHLGIEWLRRHLGGGYRVHVLENRAPDAIHIDTSFVPLAPGKVLVNPEYVDVERLPAVLRRWECLIPPEPVPIVGDPLGMMSRWGGLNVLMLDEERVIVEQRQEPLIRALRDWGFRPIPCAFEAYYPFLGSFHCATLDIRRRGELKSYF
jgi:glycine amidinotransferase